MENFKIGMYLRCPVDNEDNKYPRIFAMGQIIEVDLNFEVVTVKFHNIINNSETAFVYENIPSEKEYTMGSVKKCKVLENSKVLLNDYTNGKIICEDFVDEEGYNNYYVQDINSSKVKSYCEKDMLIHFTRAKVSPVIQMIEYELHLPFWYTKRLTPSESLYMIQNFTYGFEKLLGARTYLMSHQIDTIMSVVSEEPCRFILADEMGLGKTIEACAIMEELRKKKATFKTLIIAPESLCRQWQNELELKFWNKSKIAVNLKEVNKDNIVIIPFELIHKIDLIELFKIEWDLCIVDEVHRLVKLEKEYGRILSISKNTPNLLLLSATPIQERQDEYLSLLILLNPNKYEKMSKSEALKLYKKATEIRNIVISIYNDLQSFDKNIAENIIKELEDISDRLEDAMVKKLVKQVDIESDDKGVEKIKIILAYILQNYEIERNVIRHRREQIKDKLSKRSLQIIDYNMAGSEVNYFERDTYESLLKYIKSIQSPKDNLSKEYIEILLSAMFSSPWALREAIKSVKIFLREKEELMELTRLNELWCNAADEEFKNLKKLHDDPDLINGKLVKVLDFIIEEYDTQKFVLFASWSSTIEHMQLLLRFRFGEQAVAMYYSKMSKEKLEENILEFQNNPKCRFMICDELGGESHNLEIASKIIHMDLPFSPIALEQRIGRIDRIGRDVNKNVDSIVVISRDSIENDLFQLWDKELNIFTESLSGMEIALVDIDEEIINELNKDIGSGFKKGLEHIKMNLSKIKELLSREKYYDRIRQLDGSYEEKLDKIIDKFNKAGGQLSGQAMKEWAISSGLHSETPYETKSKDIIVFRPSKISIRSMKNNLFMIPDTEETLKRSNGDSNIIKGTFSRDISVKKEELIFFAPSEPLFESIMDNCQEGFRGKSCALKVEQGKYNWKGFIFKWNVKFNMKCLLDKGISILEASKAQCYLPMDQITTFVKLQGDDIDSESEILDLIQETNLIHLGKRSGVSELGGRYKNVNISNMQCFMREISKEKWNKNIKLAFAKAQKEAGKSVLSKIDFNAIDNDFDKILNGKKASNRYFSNEKLLIDEEEKLKSSLDAVKQGIKAAKLELDSIVYVWMEK